MATAKKAKPEVNGTGNEVEEIIPEVVAPVSQEEQTMALETIKPKDLQKLKDLDVKIEDFKKRYSSLTIVDENDEEGYENVRLALGDMRPTRTNLMAEKKDFGKPYRAVLAYGNSEYAKRINAIAAIEAPLKEKKKEIDEIEKRKKEQEKLEEEQRLSNRIDALIKNGAAFSGEYYSIHNEEFGVAEISVGVVDIRTMSDELFKQFLQQVIDKNAIIISKQEEKVRKEQEIQKEKEEEENRKRIEFEKQQSEFKKQQEELEKQQSAMYEKLKKLQDAQDNARVKQLVELGMTYNSHHQSYVFMDVNVAVQAELKVMGDAEWDALIEKIAPAIAQLKEAEIKRIEEEQRLAELVRDRVTSLQMLDTKVYYNNSAQGWMVGATLVEDSKIESLTDDVWNDVIKGFKIDIQKAKEENDRKVAEEILNQQREKEKQEKEQKEAELAAATDKKKWEHLLTLLTTIAIPEMKSPMYKKKAAEVSEFINGLK